LTAQLLALTPEERATLFERLSANAEPDQRYYDYDYYRDNCSTRVRDAVDQVLGGELRRLVSGAGRLTFRQHTLRLVGDTPWLYFGLDVALGAPTDRPTTCSTVVPRRWSYPRATCSRANARRCR
jgi:hypothetical protein